ncbi:MAG: YitT family protein, partial [Succinivibrio sp.]
LRIWAQIPFTVVFSFFLDLFMMLFSRLDPQSYPAELAVLAAGMILLALGVALQGKARFIKLAGDGVVYVATSVTGRRFGLLKTILDCSLVAASCILSLACLGSIEGVREGTLLSALLTGVMVQFFLKLLRYAPEEEGEGKETPAQRS